VEGSFTFSKVKENAAQMEVLREEKAVCSRSISSFDWEVAGTADGEAKQLLPSIHRGGCVSLLTWRHK